MLLKIRLNIVTPVNFNLLKIYKDTYKTRKLYLLCTNSASFNLGSTHFSFFIYVISYKKSQQQQFHAVLTYLICMCHNGVAIVKKAVYVP